MKVSVNAPRTPVTEGSDGVAAATLPNICKMPGPPAPFVPTPLPNVGRSKLSPKGYSKNVKIGGKNVAIGSASFGSQGDAASKGTGGGLVSANTHGLTRFVSPGSMDVQFEGKKVHLLGDMMVNNCGPSGTPANSATMAGIIQRPQPAKEECTHSEIRQEPPEDEFGYYDEARPGDGDRRKHAAGIAKKEKRLARMQKAARRKGKRSVETQDDLARSIRGAETGLAGDRWELKVAEEVDADRMGVKLVCVACGAIVGEFDVLMSDGRVKECKASWAGVDGKQFLKQVNLLERRAALGPGRVLHYALPKGARAGKRLLGRFKHSEKAAMSGRFQEH